MVHAAPASNPDPLVVDLFDGRSALPRRVHLSLDQGQARVVELVDGREVAMRDREAAQALVNVRLYVDRDTLPAPEDDDEFYLADLIGLRAVTPDGADLGKIDTVHDYGAGASLEIGRLIVPSKVAAGGADVISTITSRDITQCATDCSRYCSDFDCKPVAGRSNSFRP